MKVRELLDAFKGLDPNMDVLCTVENLERPIEEGQILDILHGDVVWAEKHRLDDGRPALRYQRSGISDKHLIFQITPDF